MQTKHSLAVNVPCGELAHLSSSPRLSTGARIFLYLFQNLIGVILSVVGDMPIDNEVPTVTSSISRICRFSFSQVIVGIRFCAYICRDECVRVCKRYLYCVIQKKKIAVRVRAARLSVLIYR